MKTKKTFKKRIKVTGTGKYLKKSVRTGHLKRKWSTNQRYRKKGYSRINKQVFKSKYKQMLGS